MSETETQQTEQPKRGRARATTTEQGSELLALSSNPAGVAAAPGNVQALPAELDEDADTPEHRANLEEAVGSWVGDDGVVKGTELTPVPPEDCREGERNGPSSYQRYPAWPGGPLI